MGLIAWAKKWGLPEAALDELQKLCTNVISNVIRVDTESDLINSIRVNASREGIRLWRNNTGVAFDKKGRPVRYGLSNESRRINSKVKSSDLIGIKPVLITKDLVGTIIGQMVAFEVKKPGWVYRSTQRERAQLAFLSIINANGGHGKFIC